jgi:methyltransferase (TIGR00027 family)
MLVPILGPALLALRERQIPGIRGNLLCRTRFIDDTFRDALARGYKQIVILGAGFDSRAYRIPGVDRVHVFELDHPTTQAWKRERIERIRGELPSHVTFVPIDFEQQELGETLVAAGFRTGLKTFVLWEGVTQYIGAEAVDSTFRYVSHTVAPGSEIVFTYIRSGIIDGSAQAKGAKKLLVELERQGEPWVFGIDPPELSQYLAARALELIEDVGAMDYRTRYLVPAGRRMDIFEGERVAVAKAMGM